jgi:phage repressor protein C with HTH and peptisase S24 domain
MITHEQVWNAIDALATRRGFSPSGLARRAGLDPTTFNRSKRVSPNGKARWPSTESLAKVLTAAGATFADFVDLLGDSASEVHASSNLRTIPLLAFAQASEDGHFDSHGFPIGDHWDAITFPGISDEHAFALEISGDSLRPVYRDGDIIVVSPASPVRRGDRVVVKTSDGEVMVKELKRRTAKVIELQSLNPAHKDRVLDAKNVEWIARIVWASQ